MKKVVVAIVAVGEWSGKGEAWVGTRRERKRRGRSVRVRTADSNALRMGLELGLKSYTVRLKLRLRVRLEGGEVGSAVTTLGKKACECLVWLYAMHPCQNHSLYS